MFRENENVIKMKYTTWSHPVFLYDVIRVYIIRLLFAKLRFPENAGLRAL